MDLESDTKVNDNGKFDAENVDAKLTSGIEAEGTSIGLSPSPATKGRGLKKWRRIRREFGKETDNNFDSNKKRGITISALPVGMNQRSEGSSSSTNAMSNVLGTALNNISLYGDLGSGTGNDFASRADSETSEDQNSRSSTAATASGPIRYHEFPVVDLGFNLSVKNSGTLVQLGDQQEKGRNVTKKARGFKIKKQNSISSMESESRSSNVVFMKGANSMTSNGRANGRSEIRDEHDSDDAQQDGHHINNASQTALTKDSADSENVVDHVVETIIPLHLAQEALEREVQKLKDVGKEDTLPPDDPVHQCKEVHNHLQSKLEEALLKSTLNFAKIKNEYDELVTCRIAAELEYLVISKTVQNLKAGHVGPVDLTVHQEDVQLEDSWEKDVKKVENRVWRYAGCFVIQLVLFLAILYMFVLQLSSSIVEVMPT